MQPASEAAVQNQMGPGITENRLGAWGLYFSILLGVLIPTFLSADTCLAWSCGDLR